MSKNKNKLTKTNQPGKDKLIRTSYVEYAGPIPPAAELERYEGICAGAADRILTMAEAQAKHRRAIEDRVIRSNTINSTLGVVFAFILGLSTILGGVFLVFNGLVVSGTILGSAGLTGLVWVFIYGTRSGREERGGKVNRI